MIDIYFTVQETAYILSGVLEEGHLEVISDNIRRTVADYLNTKLWNVDITYDVTECKSAHGLVKLTKNYQHYLLMFNKSTF